MSEWREVNDPDRRIREDETYLLLINGCRAIGVFDSFGWQVDFWIDSDIDNRIFNSYDEIVKYIQDNITHYMELPGCKCRNKE